MGRDRPEPVMPRRKGGPVPVVAPPGIRVVMPMRGAVVMAVRDPAPSMVMAAMSVVPPMKGGPAVAVPVPAMHPVVPMRPRAVTVVVTVVMAVEMLMSARFRRRSQHDQADQAQGDDYKSSQHH